MRRWLALILVFYAVAPAHAGTRGVVRDAPEPRALDQAFAPRRVALVVGVDQYTDVQLSDLQFAAADAEGMAAALQAPEGGAFDVVVALPGDVTQEEFRIALGLVTRSLERDDTFVLYFAGHGTLEAAGGTRLYLLFSDAQLDDPVGTGLALAALEDTLAGLRARRRVLIVDACFSGAGRSAWSERVRSFVQSLRGPPPPPPALEVSRFDARLFAAHYDEPAREDEALGHGVYTYFLLEALSGAGDLDGDGLVDAVEAHYHARDGTLEYTGGQQVPWLRTTEVGRDAVYLSGNAGARVEAEKAILTGLDALPDGAQLRVDGAARGAGEELLDPGLHRVAVIVDDRTVYAGSVSVRPGGRLDLADLVSGGKPPVLLGGGIEVITSREVSVPVLGHVVLWGWTEKKRRGRLGLGVAASLGYGALADQGPFLMGDVLGRVAWAWGNTFAAGPSLGAGVVWRGTGDPRFRQAGLVVAPGAHLRLMGDKGFVALDPALWFLPFEDYDMRTRATTYPTRLSVSLTLSGGFRM